MLETIRNAWKIPDLRRKIFVTIALLLIYRIGSYIPVPGLNAQALQELAKGGGTIFGFLDILSGGAFQLATIFAMSISPYINASIIMQLLTVAIPKLEQLAKEGEEGRKIIGQYVRYGTVVLGFLQATGLYFGLKGAVNNPGLLSFLVISLSFTAGTAFLMWLGEQITEYGIGNGISLIIFTGIVSRAPKGILYIQQYWAAGQLGNGLFAFLKILLIVVAFVAIVAGVVWVTQAEEEYRFSMQKELLVKKCMVDKKHIFH